MKGLIRPALFFALALWATGCSRSGDTLQGLWLGANFELDRAVHQPLPFLFDFRPDGRLLQTRLSDGKSDTLAWNWNGTLLKIDTLIFYGQSLGRFPDSLLLGKSFTQLLVRPAPANSLPGLDAVAELLTDKAWACEEEQLFFAGTDTLWVTSPPAPEALRFCWSVEAHHGLLFLVRKGYGAQCGKFAQFTEQILNVSRKSLTTRRWQDGRMRTMAYSLMPAPKIRPAAFQSCNPFLYRNFPAHRYYYKGTAYRGGLYQVRKIFDARYQPPVDSTTDGLIRIGFIVNCEGQAGQYDVLELDNNYQPTSFNTKARQQIVAITRELHDWIPGRNEAGEAIDTYRFLTFRLKHGQITDIFP